MKKTALHQEHLALGAKMVPFAGYEMPVSYQGINEEHRAVRSAAGLFDVSHMGEFIIRGQKALDLVQALTTNDAAKLQAGQAQYSCMPNGQGGIIDDLLVYRLFDDRCAEGEQAFMLVVNASNLSKDWDWIKQNNPYSAQEVQLIDISERTALIALQGPQATAILQTCTEAPVADLKYYTFTKGQVAGIDNVLISATGYTGAGGFELYVEADAAVKLWQSLMQAGQSLGLQAAGLGARDTLRLEMGYCLYGQEIDESTSPLEAGLGWITKLNKGPFMGRELMQAEKAAGLKRKLVALSIEDKRPARMGYELLNEAGEIIGRVTSGTKLPDGIWPVALAYLETAYTALGTEVYVSLRGNRLKAKVVGLPFGPAVLKPS